MRIGTVYIVAAVADDKAHRKLDGAKFGMAYDLSHTDVYNFASSKQSLKKWETSCDDPIRQVGESK